MVQSIYWSFQYVPERILFFLLLESLIVALIYQRLLTGFGMFVFFINLSLVEFQVKFQLVRGLLLDWPSNQSWWSSRLQFLPYTFYTLYIDEISGSVICNSAVCGNDITCFSKLDQLFSFLITICTVFWILIWPWRYCGSS